MDYERQMRKPNPFEGLSAKERKYLFVYMCLMAHPNLSVDEIERKWGCVLPQSEYPPVFEALDIVDKIKHETITPHSSPKPRKQPSPPFPTLSNKGKMGCCIIVCVIVTIVMGSYVRSFIVEQRHKANAARQMPLIDEEFGHNTITAYKKLCEIDKFSDDAACRRHLCDVFGIGTPRKDTQLSWCPIRGNCLERAAASEAFCKGLASLQYVYDVEGLKLLHKECKKVPRLKKYDINLLQRIAQSGDKDAIRELAESYRDGINVERDADEAVKWYSKYIICKLDVKELNKLKRLFEPSGKFPDVGLLLEVSECLAKYDDISSLLLIASKCQFSNPQKSAEYYYRALCMGATLTLDNEAMMACAKIFEQSGQLEKSIKFYERCARSGDAQAFLWMGNYWYKRIKWIDWNYDSAKNSLYEYRLSLSHRWNKIPVTNGYYNREAEEAYKNALYWLEKAAEKDDDDEVFMKLSLLHGARWGGGKLCISDLRHAIKLGNADAAFELGVVYERGLGGVVANKAEAKKLYLIAANKGDARAQLSYAYLLDSTNEAWEWVFKAARQGNVEAQYQFGRLNDFYGWGAWGSGGWRKYECSQDRNSYRDKPIIPPADYCEKYKQDAVYWYRVATRNGHKGAERELSKHGITLE